MKDFYSFDEFSIPLSVKAIFWGIYMVVYIYAAWRTLRSISTNSQDVEVSKFFVLFFAAYAVFYCVNPDYFRYREWLKIPLFLDWSKEQIVKNWNKEIFYVHLIIFCKSLHLKYTFELFRLIVWGGGVLLVSLTSKMYRNLLMPGLAVMFLFVFFGNTFSYARASLAMAIFFSGISIYLCVENTFAKMLGIGMAVCSYFFHHELVIGVGILPCILLPFEKKKSIFLSIILFAIIIAGITYVNSNLALMESIFGNDDVAEKIEYYNDALQRAFRMSTLISYLNIFYPFFLMILFMYQQEDPPKAIVGLYRITFGLLMVSSAFMIVSGLRSVYTYRVLYISIIPMSIMMAYFYNQGFFKRYQFAIMLLLALLTNSIRLINAF